MKDWDVDAHWFEEAKKQLLNRKIVKVRYMTVDEMNDLGWYSRPVVMILDDGNIIYPSRDDEGNDGGALFTTNEANPVLPVLKY
jgi:hypothetical protein